MDFFAEFVWQFLVHYNSQQRYWTKKIIAFIFEQERTDIVSAYKIFIHVQSSQTSLQVGFPHKYAT